MSINDIKITPRWDKSKDDIWNETFAGTEEKKGTKFVPFRKRRLVYSVAALLLLLLIPGYALFHTRTITAVRGNHATVLLPDGSKAILNADSRISYKPYRWVFSRDIRMEGEASFEVKKGKRFRVFSGDRAVTVLGTTFNVFSRQEGYSVTCLTGKVQVKDDTGSVILEPDMQAYYTDGQLIVKPVVTSAQVTGWISDRFYFSQAPLENVLREIERQYDIFIIRPDKNDYLYNGNFSKLKDPEEVLEIISKPFGIKLEIRK